MGLEELAQQLATFGVKAFISKHQQVLYDTTVSHMKVAVSFGLDPDATAIIVNPPDSYGRSARLYEIIQKKPGSDPLNFLEALENSGNEHVVKFIQSQLLKQQNAPEPSQPQPPQQQQNSTTTTKTVEQHSASPSILIPSSPRPSGSGQEGCSSSKTNLTSDPKDVYNCKNVRILFINNKFDDETRTEKNYTDIKRTGAEVDEKWVRNLFETNLRMKLEVENNVDSDDVAVLLKRFKKNCIADKNDGCIVIISTHGGSHHSLVMDDLNLVHLEQDVIQKFGRDSFPGFDDKPKIFLVNACRNETKKAGEALVSGSDSDWDADFYKDSMDVPFANILVGHSTLPLHFSFRAETGSLYIKFLHDVCHENGGGDLEIREILHKVGERVANLITARDKVQVPEYRVILFGKKYYLTRQS